MKSAINPLPHGPIALSMGDPAGIGPELAQKAWMALRGTEFVFFVVGNPEYFTQNAQADATAATSLIQTPKQAISAFSAGLPILPISTTQIPTDKPPRAYETIASIEQSVAFCKSGQASAIVTNPIAKSVLYGAGFAHPGHTEFLGHLAKDFPMQPAAKGPVMMLCGGGLRVALVSIHTALADVPAQITAKRVQNTAMVLHHALQNDFGICEPRIAMCGLNPHAGEDGAMGREEIEILNPVAENLRQQGINITNALPADTLFRDDLRGQYDAVLAMYHDQGLIPVKTLDFHGGTNVTLGLPFVRVSPDHGTGFDIAGKNIARPDSLIAALKLAHKLAKTRRQSQ